MRRISKYVDGATIIDGKKKLKQGKVNHELDMKLIGLKLLRCQC